MNTKDQETLSQAMTLGDNMKLLAAEYQHLVRSGGKADAHGQAARRSLDRKFQKLQAASMIAKLTEKGFEEAAIKFEDLFHATAMVFNLVAVSIGVDEQEVLGIDIEAAHAAAIAALQSARKK